MRRPALATLACVLGLAACGGGDAAGGPTGTITIDGSSTVAPISEAISEEFRRDHGNGIEVSVGTSGTGGGFTRFCNGEIDIADASRAITDEERAACAGNGVEFEELRVALDGLAITTSAENDFVDCLDFEQLAAIFREDGADRWNEVDPRFPRQDIAIFAPGTDSGTYDFFVEEVLGDPDDGGVRARTDYTASEDDNVLVQGIEGEEGSWGFFGYAYLQANAGRVRAVEVAGDDGRCVAPTSRTIRTGDYPLSRPLFVYVSKASLEKTHVRAFVRYYLQFTDDLVADVGYVASPASDYAAALARLEPYGV